MRDEAWTLRPLEDELGEALRAELLSWPSVTARPTMGTLGFYRRRRFLGCYINRILPKKKSQWLNRLGEPTFVWVRLRRSDAERALRRAGVRPTRIGFPGWVEISLESREMLEEAVRWFGQAYEHPARSPRKRR